METETLIQSLDASVCESTIESESAKETKVRKTTAHTAPQHLHQGGMEEERNQFSDDDL